MIKKLVIENFRLFDYLEINDLKRINLFVGENNSGKSTIIESLFLNIGATNAELPLRINAFRNYNRIDDITFRSFFRNFDIEKPIRINTYLKKPTQYRNLSISPLFSQQKTEKVIQIDKILAEEHTSITSSEIEGLNYKLEIKETTKGNYKSYLSKIRKNGSGFLLDQPVNYEEKIRGIFLAPRTFPRENAKRLGKMQFEKRTNDIVIILKEIEPDLKSIILLDNNFIFADIGYKNLIPVSLMGDGINRILSIVLALSENRNGIVLIDEIENGFHYKSQRVLWKAIFQAAVKFNVQIFATTHSWENIKTFIKTTKELSNNDIMLYRVESHQNKYRVVEYNYDLLQQNLESEWEIR